MVADGFEAMGRTHAGSPVTRAELELAVRTDLVDFGATGWHARVAADYILAAVDDYLGARRDRLQDRMREIIDFYLSPVSDSDRRASSDIARWMAEDCHRALCSDPTHHHEDTPWSVSLTPNS